MPTASAPTAGREPSRARSASLNPSPPSPSRFSTGTSQSVRCRATVGEPRIPIFRSSLPRANPGNVGSTRNAVTPFFRRPRSTVAKSVMTDARLPLDTQSFTPFRMYRSPRRTAFVEIEAASEPAPGSEREKAAVISPDARRGDRKSTRLNSSHSQISYAVFCLKKKKKKKRERKPKRKRKETPRAAGDRCKDIVTLRAQVL